MAPHWNLNRLFVWQLQFFQGPFAETPQNGVNHGRFLRQVGP
jgi:hypothetical protein